jgi:hypothetical protein
MTGLALGALKVIAALVVVMGPGGSVPAPRAQVRACELDVAAYVNAGGNLARHVDSAIRHDCGRRAGLDRRQVRSVRWFAERWISLHNS